MPELEEMMGGGKEQKRGTGNDGRRGSNVKDKDKENRRLSPRPTACWTVLVRHGPVVL